MAERGIYRSTFTVILDSPEFLDLPPQARHVFLTLKVSRINNMAGIFIFGSGELATLVEQTGVEQEDVRNAIHELSGGHWLFVEGGLMWLRNHLKYDPHISLANPKHKKGIISIISALPRVDLVLKFCDYYELPYPFDSLSHTPSIPYAKHNKEKEEDKEKEKEQDKEQEATPIPPIKIGKPKKLDKSEPPHIRFDYWRSENKGLIYEMGKTLFLSVGEIETALMNMRAWILANPIKGNKKDWRKFAGTWLRKVRQDKEKYINPMTASDECYHYRSHKTREEI